MTRSREISHLWILQSYEQFIQAENNIKQNNLNSFLAVWYLKNNVCDIRLIPLDHVTYKNKQNCHIFFTVWVFERKWHDTSASLSISMKMFNYHAYMHAPCVVLSCVIWNIWVWCTLGSSNSSSIWWNKAHHALPNGDENPPCTWWG